MLPTGSSVHAQCSSLVHSHDPVPLMFSYRVDSSLGPGCRGDSAQGCDGQGNRSGTPFLPGARETYLGSLATQRVIGTFLGWVQGKPVPGARLLYCGASCRILLSWHLG